MKNFFSQIEILFDLVFLKTKYFQEVINNSSYSDQKDSLRS